RTMSLPSSPMDGSEQQKLNVQRCGSNPFLLKEPPRYDEAIKNKQQQTAGSSIDNINNNNNNNSSSSTGNNNNSSNPLNGVTKGLNLSRLEADIKSQAMDDVLEILIRNGDLPPSAASEALQALTGPPTSKASVSSTSPVNTAVTSTTSLSPSYMSLHSSLAPSPPPALAVSPPVGSPSAFLMRGVLDQQTQRDVTFSAAGLFSDVAQDSHVQSSGMSSSNLASVPSPSQTQVSSQTSSTANCLTLQDGASQPSELLDWGMMLPSPDLSNMDWSQDHGFGSLDQGEGGLGMEPGLLGLGHSVSQLNPNDLLGLEQLMESSSGAQDAGTSLSSSFSSGLHTPSGPGSQLDLTGPSKQGLDSGADQMDMSDWLDVIMPGPPSMAPPHPSYSVPQTSSVDPILTPRTQQDVFDIFNFDDPDFGPSTMTWDRMAEQSTST
ncbi:hypothetical protein EGW08_016180, partial [Elysia chlorotica]